MHVADRFPSKSLEKLKFVYNANDMYTAIGLALIYTTVLCDIMHKIQDVED